MQGRFNHWVRLVLANCLVVCLFLIGAGRVMGESAKGSWDSRFTLPPGLNGEVNAMVSLGNFLVVGGSFSRAGGVEAHGLAMWDGSRWWPLGGGVDGQVNALALSNDGLYVGGVFTHAGGKPANNVAKWNGIWWDPMDGGVQEKHIGYPSVNALYVQGNDVYAGGMFSQAGNIAAQNIARWDGHAWHRLGDGMGRYYPEDLFDYSGWVFALTGDGANLYVGGIFRYAGNVAATNLACWNGKNWKAIGNTVGGVGTPTLVYGEPFYGSVSSLAIYQNKLYVAGDFLNIGGVAATNFARWDGISWQNIPGFEMPSYITFLKATQGSLYVGGRFDHVGGIAATNLAVLKNGVWSGMRAEITTGWEDLRAFELIGNGLYVGGEFGLFNGKSVGHIVKCEQGTWKPLGVGIGNSLDYQVSSLAVEGTNVYAVGFFQNAGTNAVHGMAKWDGVKWSPIGVTNEDYYGQIAAVGNNVYVRTVMKLPGIGYTSLGCWNGSEWSVLPTIGTNYVEFDNFLRVGNRLYVSGQTFDPEVGWMKLPLSGWDGTNWNSVPLTQSDSVICAEDGTNLYILNYFKEWDPQKQVNLETAEVLKWDETQLERVGKPVDGFNGRLMAVSGEQVYLLGSWATNDNRSVLIRGNGSQWKQIGSFSQQDGFVRSMVAMGRNLYVGGYFDSIAGLKVNNIAQWDGRQWRSLGSGIGGLNVFGAVLSMAGSDGKLYVGGIFSMAGGKESGNFAVWTEGR